VIEVLSIFSGIAKASRLTGWPLLNLSHVFTMKEALITNGPTTGAVKAIEFTDKLLSHLRKCLSYREESGELIWRYRDDASAQWNSKHAGKLAGTKHVVNGCPRSVMVGLSFNGKKRCLKAHRIIYSIFVRALGTNEEIDHKDRNPFNNRIDNLRLSTRSGNCHNIRKKTGMGYDETLPKGVQRHGSRFRAQIMVDLKRKSLGTFRTMEEAAMAYQTESQKRVGEFSIFNT
jgi:hypothetical protein